MTKRNDKEAIDKVRIIGAIRAAATETIKRVTRDNAAVAESAAACVKRLSDEWKAKHPADAVTTPPAKELRVDAKIINGQIVETAVLDLAAISKNTINRMNRKAGKA